MMVALAEHEAKAAAMARESSATPPDEVYVDGMTQTLPRELGPKEVAGAGAAETALSARERATRLL